MAKARILNIQLSPKIGDKLYNCNKVGQYISNNAKNGLDLVVVPEFFSTGIDSTSFVEYECYKTYTDGEFSNPCGTYIPGVQINPPEGKNEDTLYFVAQYQVCPIGHYCDSNGQHECPGGTTTTSTGTSSISSCVMQRGASGTKFCDSTGNCFYIPDSRINSGAIPGK